jgi:hypothetical protein
VLDGDLCIILRGSLGRQHVLEVAKLVNGHEIRSTTSLPTIALAFSRFKAAFTAATSDWIVAGPLSATHMAMVRPLGSNDFQQKLEESVRRYEFVDPFGGAGTVRLEVITASAELVGLESLDQAFQAIENGLQAASEALPDQWLYPDDSASWCRDHALRPPTGAPAAQDGEA